MAHPISPLMTCIVQQDSESEEELPARRRGPPKGRGANAAAANVKPEECKNQ